MNNLVRIADQIFIDDMFDDIFEFEILELE